jgi:hypothetical protein
MAGNEMTISRITHLAEPALTNQQLADMALTEWQAARRAAERREFGCARRHIAEALQLLKQLADIEMNDKYIDEPTAMHLLSAIGDYSPDQARIILGQSLKKTFNGQNYYPADYIQKRVCAS